MENETFFGLEGTNPVDSTRNEVEETSQSGADVEVGEVKAIKASTPINAITVQVNDPAPILLLFGAPSSGKTMTLVRLAKYLRTKNYSIVADPTFCNKNCWEYEENIKRFNGMLSTTTALPGTDFNDFLFIKILDGRGKTVCQILEGAGEDYFPSKTIQGVNRAENPFPPYMTGIFHGNNKKVWMFLTEPNWNVSFQDKEDYVERIKYCKHQYFLPKDQCIILYNKVDKTPFTFGGGKVHKDNAMIACNNEYQGLFDAFKYMGPFPLLNDKYTCKFVPFSTGSYGQAVPGQDAHYTPSNDNYPAVLWDTIEKCIRG